jgi:hypothetical protein
MKDCVIEGPPRWGDMDATPQAFHMSAVRQGVRDAR